MSDLKPSHTKFHPNPTGDQDTVTISPTIGLMVWKGGQTWRRKKTSVLRMRVHNAEFLLLDSGAEPHFVGVNP
jgi:hypothetical protein